MNYLCDLGASEQFLLFANSICRPYYLLSQKLSTIQKQQLIHNHWYRCWKVYLPFLQWLKNLQKYNIFRSYVQCKFSNIFPIEWSIKTWVSVEFEAITSASTYFRIIPQFQGIVKCGSEDVLSVGRKFDKRYGRIVIVYQRFQTLSWSRVPNSAVMG